MNPSDNYHDEDAFGPNDDITWEPQPVCWRRLDRAAAFTTWHALDTWTRWCIRRYDLDHRTIPRCWYRHGALVEEVSALRTAWQAAHTHTAPGNAPLEWHAMFALTRQRLQDWTARSGCRPDEHREQQPAGWVNEPDIAFTSHVIHDGDTRDVADAQQWPE